MRIDKLTPAQTARFAEWSQKWIDIGLSTEPADFEAATEAALKAYKLCNLNKPMVVLRMGSPYGATLGGVLAWSMLHDLPKLRSQVDSQVGDATNNYRGGAYWASWCAYVSFFRDICGWKDPILERFEIDETLTKSCGWVWWHENVLAISDRPTLIKRDDQGRLHCENGPSIAYRDGWALHHWHGVSIPAEWVSGKKPSAKEVLTWTNVEQRRAACEIVGWANVLESNELKSKVIDVDEPHIGTLIQVDLPDAPKQWFLKYQCGTGRWFAESVNDKSFNTALKANAGGNGWRGVGDPLSFIPFIRS